MRTSVFLCLYAWLVSYSHVCLAGDTLNAGDRITGNVTLVSIRKVFELGFFSPSDDSTYLEDGNLKVLSPNGNVHWSSELKGFSAENRTVMLMDSGNLVLKDNHSGNFLWQSFEHPADTFLPGMKMNQDLNMTCWMADDDPRPGNYTFKPGSVGVNNYIISRNQGQLYWESDSVGETISGLVVNLLTNFTQVVKDSNNQTKRPVPSIDNDYNIKRLWMNSRGKIQFLERANSTEGWSPTWVAPENLCRTYNYCGNFSSCSTRASYPCKCLPGFSLTSPHDIGEFGDSGYYPQPDEEGCARKSEQSRENTTFINLQEVKVGNPDLRRNVDEAECESLCRNMSSECQAFSYEFTEKSTSTCWIWKTDLTTVEEEYLEHGRNLSVRVNNLDIDENQHIEFSSPFHVDKQCYEKALGVIWDPPLEPNCSNSTDCLGWAHSTCNASATGIGKCICDTSYGWNDSTLSCTSQGSSTPHVSSSGHLLLELKSEPSLEDDMPQLQNNVSSLEEDLHLEVGLQALHTALFHWDDLL
ncbi:hypothetical protein L6164_016520 [Bauhinia variegata]|uniref:Uncharacterized protein n=1 Tax=Bauhinia variegata TaxID=167791 RepID=A0ACB9NTD4_BAUVA|nr:hypothetical protein L6164_016520 [Bauhinia variegata]